MFSSFFGSILTAGHSLMNFFNTDGGPIIYVVD